MGWRFCIAEFRFEIVETGEPSLAAIGDDWRDFRTGDAPDTLIEVELTEPIGRAPDWVPRLPELIPNRDGSLAIVGDGFSAQVSADRRQARVRQPPERFPLEALVRVLLAQSLLSRRGLVLHSVGLASAGSAGVFVGESGAGKTTLGGLCRGAGLLCLSDELVGVTPSGPRYIAHGTPWNIGRCAQAAVKMVGLLAHASSARVFEHSESDLLRTLLPNTLMADPSPSGRALIFRCAADLIGGVRPVRLQFAREPSVASLLARQLALPSRLTPPSAAAG
jgi:hypothetical protein